MLNNIIDNRRSIMTSSSGSVALHC